MANRPGAHAFEERHRELWKGRSKRNAGAGRGCARRTAAAVNAVEGIPTVMLEGGVVRSLLLRHVRQLLAEVPDLRKILVIDDAENGPLT
jgi:hypothetical protein